MLTKFSHTLVVALSLASGTLAFAGKDVPVLDNHNLVNLNLDTRSVTINIPYPAMEGERCGVELRTSVSFPGSDGMKKLTDNLLVTVGVHKGREVEAQAVGYGPVTYAFPDEDLHKYMTLVHITTRDGSSLRRAISRLEDFRKDPVTAVVRTLNCNEL